MQSRQSGSAEVYSTLQPWMACTKMRCPCYLLIYADGYHSDEEKTRIKMYADALGVSDAQLNDVHLKARGFLLQELAAGLRNRDALTEVGVELGLTDDDINNVIQ